MKLLFSFSLALLYTSLFGQFMAKTESVYLYTNATYYEQSSRLNLKPGYQSIYISNIAQDLRLNELRFGKIQGLNILAHSIQEDYINPNEMGSERKALEEDIEDLEKELRNLNARKNLLNEELNLFKNHQSLIGPHSKLSMEDLLEMGDLYQQRLLPKQIKIFQLGDSIQSLSNELLILKKQKAQLPHFSPFKRIIRLDIYAEKAINEDLTFSYQVPGLGWQAEYTIESQDNSNFLNIAFNARFSNQSGINWNNAQLYFSTAPRINSSRLPQLQSKTVDYLSYNIRGSRTKAVYEVAKVQSDDNAVDEAEMNFDFEASREENGNKLFFKQPQRNTIPNGTKNFKINLKEDQVNCTKYYASYPEADQFAHLMAEVDNAAEYFPISGKCLYWNNQQLSNVSYHNTNQLNQVDRLDMGQDQLITVERREKLLDKDSKILGNKESREYTIKVVNNKASAIDLKLYDLYPIALNESIKVSVNTGGANNDTDKGILLWNLKLESKQEEKIRWDYSLKFEGNKEIQIR